VLIEQARWRIKEREQRLPPVSNVLYAVPIDAVLVSLGIPWQALIDPGLEMFQDRMVRLKNIEPNVDPELVREIEKEVARRYVFGE
jgi:hypothetical protein